MNTVNCKFFLCCKVYINLSHLIDFNPTLENGLYNVFSEVKSPIEKLGNFSSLGFFTVQPFMLSTWLAELKAKTQSPCLTSGPPEFCKWVSICSLIAFLGSAGELSCKMEVYFLQLLTVLCKLMCLHPFHCKWTGVGHLTSLFAFESLPLSVHIVVREICILNSKEIFLCG